MPDRGTALTSQLAGGTKIEWADFTFNPWWGCERVSPACAHCYADAIAHQRQPGKQLWGAGHEFRFFGDVHWADPLKWARNAPAKLGRRPRVFCASMADVFEERDEIATARFRLLSLIIDTPELDWLVLTKRPDFARDWLERAFTHKTSYDSGPLPSNLWMGVSIENSRFTWRADVLREIPAAVRFISAEPLLGSLYPSTASRNHPAVARTTRKAGDAGAFHPASGRTSSPLDLSGIDWVIIGGESGPKARRFDIEHAREIIQRCDPYAPVCCGNRDAGACCGEPEPVGAREALPAVFVKQLGARPVRSYLVDGHPCSASVFGVRDRKGGDPDEWPEDLRIREHPESAA